MQWKLDVGAPWLPGMGAMRDVSAGRTATWGNVSHDRHAAAEAGALSARIGARSQQEDKLMKRVFAGTCLAAICAVSLAAQSTTGQTYASSQDKAAAKDV